MGPLFWIVAASTALSCFFALAGYSLRLGRRSRLEEAFGGPGGRKRLEVLDRHLAALRLTAAFLRSVANLVLTVAMLYVFDVWREGPWALAGAMLSAAGILTVAGIVIPQAWASYSGERVVASTLPVLLACRYALWPIVGVMRAFDVPIRRLTGAAEGHDDDQAAAKAEILQAASEGQAEGAVQPDQVEMIQSVMEFGTTQVGQIMTPRTDIFAVPADLPIREACARIVQAGHSRVPVYQGDLDNIVGVLYAKDLLCLVGRSDEAPLTSLMRKCYFVPETKPLDDLLREFRRRKVHIAVVLDEYGGTAGLATIEDVLEEIVGEIADEYDDHEPAQMKRLDERSAEVDARMRIAELNGAMGLRLPDQGDYDTVAGFMYAQLGYIPGPGERLDSHGARFTVLAADERRIIKLRVERIDQPQPADD